MTSGIYCIRNTENGKIYIGSSVDCEQRFRYHLSGLRGNYHDNSKLNNAWNKYGEKNFELFVAEEVKDLNFLRAREQCWINREKPEYNLDMDAWGSIQNTLKIKKIKPTVYQWTDKQRQAMSERMKGNTYSIGRVLSEEHKKILRERGKICFLGKKHTDKTKHRISELRKEMFANGYISINKGIKLESEYTREKMRVSSSKRWYGPLWFEKFVEKWGYCPNV